MVVSELQRSTTLRNGSSGGTSIHNITKKKKKKKEDKVESLVQAARESDRLWKQ
jgi:hypothetical protein